MHAENANGPVEPERTFLHFLFKLFPVSYLGHSFGGQAGATGDFRTSPRARRTKPTGGSNEARPATRVPNGPCAGRQRETPPHMHFKKTALALAAVAAATATIALPGTAHAETEAQKTASTIPSWYKWGYGTPVPSNPILDTTGAKCGVNQPRYTGWGDNWFLAGSFGSDPVTRNCTVPLGRTLFIPVANYGYGAF